MKALLIVCSLLWAQVILAAESFQEVIKQIDQHESVHSVLEEAQAIDEKGSVQGSWGDPMLGVAAQNYPKDSLKNNKTPMTGIQYSLSQNVALTPKYGKRKQAFSSMAQAKKLSGMQLKRMLRKHLWELAIKKEQVLKDLNILKENLSWIEKMLKISKKLYANGKIAQQGLLEIEIRKSEVESQISNKEYQKQEISTELMYLARSDVPVDLSLDTVPWSILESEPTDKIDYKEEALQKSLTSRDLMLTSQKLNYVPDLKVGLSYTKRANIDGHGDFVGLSLTFPLPFSSTKYSAHSQTAHERYQAEKDLRSYQREKLSKLKSLGVQRMRIEDELNILKKKTKHFARNAREITAKSYRLGGASYFELLKSELKLQEILTKETTLMASLKLNRLEKKFLEGSTLYE